MVRIMIFGYVKSYMCCCDQNAFSIMAVTVRRAWRPKGAPIGSTDDKNACYNQAAKRRHRGRTEQTFLEMFTEKFIVWNNDEHVDTRGGRAAGYRWKIIKFPVEVEIQNIVEIPKVSIYGLSHVLTGQSSSRIHRDGSKSSQQVQPCKGSRSCNGSKYSKYAKYQTIPTLFPIL